MLLQGRGGGRLDADDRRGARVIVVIRGRGGGGVGGGGAGERERLA